MGSNCIAELHFAWASWLVQLWDVDFPASSVYPHHVRLETSSGRKPLTPKASLNTNQCVPHSGSSYMYVFSIDRVTIYAIEIYYISVPCMQCSMYSNITCIIHYLYMLHVPACITHVHLVFRYSKHSLVPCAVQSLTEHEPWALGMKLQ